ncbi:MAG: fasciclin domain-containing protein [Pyrinomonadaceae bacterium]|nr:fasciclin domain-containing protein [Pyrinomonadaceae bacterium]MBA3572647.1 fasciclin domain-containing protein [Pyrinomonadaceae bacterium]
MEQKFDIVDTAIQAGKFSTLATALTAAGLVERLKGDGPFTVFAPTDEAFAKVPQETLRKLLKPENKDKLTAILTYHVVAGKIMARDVVNVNKATTVQGQSIKIDAKDGVKIDGAKVITADIEATNGVIHVIDAVLMPSNAAAA